MLRFVLSVLAAAMIAVPASSEVMRTHPAPGLEDYDVPFWPGEAYRSEVRSPSDFLGYPLGSKPSSHADIIRYFTYLSENFPNAQLHEYARTYEGRECVYLIVTSEQNASRLEEIRADIRKLADPRRMRASEAEPLIENTPAVAWLAYGIHGDELSSCDAALQMGYQLIAGTDDVTERIRNEVVVVIDPLENPDGRTRWLGMLEQYRGVVNNYDVQSMHHNGVWPRGRTNHYLFDLNRDWFANVHPETRGKTRAILDWMPQYMLDCHEMGPTNTYLFSPPREPFNPYMTDYIHKWWGKVAEENAAMFDRYGWAYYTREWNEEFFPGYGSSWTIYLGSIGMLFEQAGVDGSAVKRPEGTVMAYRETVHHQFIASMSNLVAIASGRQELLEDFFQLKLRNVRSDAAAFIFPPSDNASRLERFASKLVHQDIEVERATESFKAGRCVSGMREQVRNRSFPEGTLIVRTNQPLKQLIEVILSFDIRIPTSFLEAEKKEILKHRRSKLYESTGWSMPLAYGLDAWYTTSAPKVSTEPWQATAPEGGLSGEESTVGFVFDGTDDRALHLLARLLERGVRVRSAKRVFRNGEHEYPRGSFQVRRSDNPHLDAAELGRLAEDAGVEVTGIVSGLGKGPWADLGGEAFVLLEAPRIALVGGNPTSFYNFGAIWHLLDSRLQLRTTTLDLSGLARAELSKYNVIILPHNWGGAMNYKQHLGKAGIDKLKDWVRNGGTLVAEGNASAFLADSSVAVSSVRLRRQSLSRLALYEDALGAEVYAEAPPVDSLTLWEGKEREDGEEEETEKESVEEKRIKGADEVARRLFPRGSILRTRLDDEHWLTTGCGPEVPVLFNTNYAFLASGSVQVPGRLAGAQQLRLSGLLWDEARERWADTAWLTRESSGKGQVILFATLPNFRGYFHGAERLLLNALLLGPGFGARQPLEW